MSYHTSIEVAGRTHVLTPYNNTYRGPYPMPNYHGTGMALCGVTKKGESLDKWIKRRG
jgi:hypothetical protein